MVRKNCRSLLFLLSLICLFLGTKTWAAEIRVTPDREEIRVDESFNLVFHADGSVDGEPNFRFLQNDFEILQQSESSSMQIINGTLSKKKEWTVTLMPKSAGTFVIPPVAFGNDRSPVLALKVAPAKTPQATEDAAPIFIEVSAKPQTAYVQSQVIYTIRLFRAQTLSNASLSEPKLSDADAVIERLADDRQFEEIRDGQRYLVLERRYAILPQQSGQLTVSPIQFEGQVRGRFQSRTFFNQGGGIRRLRSKRLTLNILPVPQDKIRGRWLPAQALRIQEQWPDIENEFEGFKAGEPVTRILTLRADGLTAAQLPEIKMNLPEGFKSYPDQAELKDQKKLSGLVGIRRETVAIIPTVPGAYVLPAIEIPWWNIKEARMEVARLPERHISVAPALKSDQPVFPPQKETAPIPVAPVHRGEDQTQKPAGFWSWLSLILGLGWALTLIAWWGSRQKPSIAAEAGDGQNRKPDLRPVKKQLKKACLQNEAQAAKEALLTWARLRWPGRPASLGEIGKRVPSELAEEIGRLNAVLYRPGQDPWQGGQMLWEAFEKTAVENSTQRTRKNTGLAPMVP